MCITRKSVLCHFVFSHIHKHIHLNRIHTQEDSMAKITHEDIQKLDEEEEEVYQAMRDLADISKPNLFLLKREMKKRGRSERRVNAIVETLVVLGKVRLGAGDREGEFEVIN